MSFKLQITDEMSMMFLSGILSDADAGRIIKHLISFSEGITTEISPKDPLRFVIAIFEGQIKQFCETYEQKKALSAKRVRDFRTKTGEQKQDETPVTHETRYEDVKRGETQDECGNAFSGTKPTQTNPNQPNPDQPKLELTPPNPQGGNGAVDSEKGNRGGKVVDDPEFEALWVMYPNKKAKKDARKAWGQVAKLRPAVDVLKASLEKQVRWDGWVKDGGAFVPLLGTWLRGERWNDVSGTPGAVAGSVRVPVMGLSVPCVGRPVTKAELYGDGE